jgi:hypothetical protein
MAYISPSLIAQAAASAALSMALSTAFLSPCQTGTAPSRKIPALRLFPRTDPDPGEFLRTEL